MLQCDKLAVHFLLRFLEPAALRLALLLDARVRLRRGLSAWKGEDHDGHSEDGQEGHQREKRHRGKQRPRIFGLRSGLVAMGPAETTLSRERPEIGLGPCP